VFSALLEELLQHMRKEEEVLFPAIRSLDLPGSNSNVHIQAPIRVMEQEHDEAGFLLEEIRTLTNNYTIPEQACTTFRISLMELEEFEARMHEHVHLENNILFPKALHMMIPA
ncbi:MAG TPA: hemerythrin domain-containing protein, partial [Ferruginibacter sp.]|nr:hemerythrin domain-containing protein [Ferruginibacter sp.]